MTLRAWSRKAYHPTASRLCVQILYVESLRSRVGLVRSVRTEEIFLERERIFSSVSDSRRETSGVRVFRPLASESETLDWSRKERSRVRIECRSACGNERFGVG